MTDVELVDKLIKSTKPSDIFPDDWKKLYLSYSKLIHPDFCSLSLASDAMAKMNNYKDLLENGMPFVDESGPFRVFEKRIEYVVTKDNKALLTKSYNNYKILMGLHDKSSENFKRYLPESMVMENDKLIIRLKDRSVPLSGQQLPQIHVNWLFSRMFELTLWFTQIGYSHMGFNPTTVFVVPETHGIIAISFYHMIKIGKKAETISAKYKMWYPTDLFTKKIASEDVDLELCKKIALYLLGDKSACGTKLRVDKNVNQKILSFLIMKHENNKDEYTQYREIIKNNFEKKFYPLNL